LTQKGTAIECSRLKNTMKNKKTVVIGMSGGVDSAIAAKILKDEGFNVIGLFMNNWEEKDDRGECTSAQDWQDVQTICQKIDIPSYSVNFAKEYYDRVFKYFLDEYKSGRTPNPDVLCNREIKFHEFANYAKKLGADYIATGHYARLENEELRARNENNENLIKSSCSTPLYLKKAIDDNKCQTYFLNQVKTEQLQNVLFPLGYLKKPDVREIAKSLELSVAEKKDSTGICFIGERNFRDFLKNYLPAQPGKIIDTNGREVGFHDGLMYYTLGQRRGLGIGGIAGEENNRWFVVKKDLTTNTLIVSNGEGEELLSTSFKTAPINIIGDWESGMRNEVGHSLSVKTRYREKDIPAIVKINSDLSTEVNLLLPARAVTSGQYAVFYDNERCIGGGVIL